MGEHVCKLWITFLVGIGAKVPFRNIVALIVSHTKVVALCMSDTTWYFAKIDKQKCWKGQIKEETKGITYISSILCTDLMIYMWINVWKCIWDWFLGKSIFKVSW